MNCVEGGTPGEVEADEFKLRSEASGFGGRIAARSSSLSNISLRLHLLAMSTCPPYAPFFGFGGVAASVGTMSISELPVH